MKNVIIFIYLFIFYFVCVYNIAPYRKREEISSVIDVDMRDNELL